MMRLVKPGRSAVWTKERIDALTSAEVRQLRANAERLSEADIALCDEILKARPEGTSAKTVKAKRAAA